MFKTDVIYRLSRSYLRFMLKSHVYWHMGKFEFIMFVLKFFKTSSHVQYIDDELVIRVRFFKGEVGPKPGSQWYAVIKNANECTKLSYQLFIPEDFDFVKGGKLPGLAGGQLVAGGKKPDGYNGWTARYMFKEQGQLCLYLYHVNMPEKYGDKFYLKDREGNFLKLPLGQWITVEQTVKLNRINNADGQILTSIDGVLYQQLNGLVFRKKSDLKIDKLFFSSFFGGDGQSYAPPKDCYLYFKDFKLEHGTD